MNVIGKVALLVSFVGISSQCLSEESIDQNCNKYNYMVNGWSAALQKACFDGMDKGHSEAIVIVGLHLIDNKELESGIEMLEIAAKAKNNFALYWLGLVHLRELAPNSDPSKAIYYLKQVKDELEPSALTNMAVMYAEGSGVSADLGKAIKLFERSMEMLAEPLKDINLMNEINADKWLSYQWIASGSELAFHIEKYNLDIGKNPPKSIKKNQNFDVI